MSAIKVDGKRSYRGCARAKRSSSRRGASRSSADRGGQLPRWKVTVLDVEIRIACSSGTYIRAIARDLGAALGVGGHLTALRRTAVGPFTVGRADPRPDHGGVLVTSMADAARAAFPSYDLDAEQAQEVRFGRALPLEIDALTAVFAPDGEFLALYRPEGGRARAAAVFVG